jgi:hypothetical protein
MSGTVLAPESSNNILMKDDVKLKKKKSELRKLEKKSLKLTSTKNENLLREGQSKIDLMKYG